MSIARQSYGCPRSRSEVQEGNLRVAFIDDVPHARRDVLVQTVAAEMERKFNRVIDIVVPDRAVELTHCDCLDIAVIVVGDRQLSHRTDGELPRKYCASIADGYRLLDRYGDSNRRMDLYLVVKHDLAGVDLLSMLLSGVSGVADLDGLAEITYRAISIGCQQHKDGQYQRLLIGECSKTLDRFSDDSRDITLDLWKVILAFAEVPVDQLDLGERVNQSEAAVALNSWSRATGYMDDGNTYRRIGRLAKMISYSNQQDEDGEIGRLHAPEKLRILPNLPLYVRQMGYPSCLLPIRRRRQESLAMDLYKSLQQMRLRVSHTEVGLEIGLVDIPRLW